MPGCYRSPIVHRRKGSLCEPPKPLKHLQFRQVWGQHCVADIATSFLGSTGSSGEDRWGHRPCRISNHSLVGCWVGCFVVALVGRLVAVASFLVDCLVGWLVAWLVGELSALKTGH